jgi:hypothetical protein
VFPGAAELGRRRLDRRRRPRSASWRPWIGIAVFLLVAFSGVAAAQQGSSSAGNGYVVMGAAPSSTSGAKAQGKSGYVTAPDGPPADEANRKALEDRAGNDGGKMLLRSTPSGARAFVDGAFVGRTPLLLIVAPGKYKILMQNEREAAAERTVVLAAKETQAVALTLAPRYPDRVTAK